LKALCPLTKRPKFVTPVCVASGVGLGSYPVLLRLNAVVVDPVHAPRSAVLSA
jgi:hypothetical protein